MSRSRFINLIICILFIVLVTMIIFVGGRFLAYKGILFKGFMGFTMVNWFRIIIGIITIMVILYDFTSLRANRKKYGEVKYILKREDKIRQVAGFIVMVIALCVQAYILTEGFEKLDSNILLLLYFPTPIILVIGYHNLQKEGLGEGGVYYWGDVIPWENVLSYSFKENILVVVTNKKSLGFSNVIDITFTINDADKVDIEEFLCDRVGKVMS